MKAEDFDRKFDDGENIIEYLDLTKIKRSNSEEQTIAFEFPSWMVEALEQESQRRDLPLQAIVKDWIDCQRLDWGKIGVVKLKDDPNQHRNSNYFDLP